MSGDVVRFPGFEGDMLPDTHVQHANLERAKGSFYAGVTIEARRAVHAGVPLNEIAGWFRELADGLEESNLSKE